MLACSAMVACTNEDVIDNPNENPALNGDNAYLAIKVVNGSAASRAGAEPGGYQDGESTENYEKGKGNVALYFYNGNLFHSKVTDKDFTPAEGTTENVEEVLGATVVLSDLASKGVPTHVVAVLNGPSGWDTDIIDANSTLEELYKKTTDASVSTTNAFIITNSTSQEDATLDDTYHFATKIADGKFKTSATEATQAGNYVEIFVERLASKVKLAAKSGAPFADNEFTLEQYYVDGTKQDLKIKITGWNLNATAKNSYMIKNLPSGETSSIEGYKYGIKDEWDWSDEANHRDYWAASVNYNTGTYYGSFGNAADQKKTTDKDDSNNTDAELTLNYISWNEIGTNKFDDDLYCRENTNTLDILTKKDENGSYVFNGAVTSVLIAAKVVAEDEDGEEYGVGLVKYANTLFTDNNFLAYIANQLDSPNYAYWTEGEGESLKKCFVKFDADFLEITPLYDGFATASLVAEPYKVINAKIAAAEEDSELKGLAELTDATVITWVNAKNEPVEEKNDEGEVTTTNIVAYTADAFGITALNIEAEHYKDGMMYYNIPIKHLRGGEMITEGFESLDSSYHLVGTTNTKTDFALREADYGVVRNHYYQITVNTIANLGKAVSNGDEDIIPNTDFSELYYVGASINILSWKIVNQGVDL